MPPTRTARALLVASALALLAGAAAPARAQPPEHDYLQFCVGCHRVDGSGSAQNGVPDMRGVVGRFLRTPTGRAFVVQVAGVAQAPLDDAALATLLNWLLPRMDAAGLPDDFQPYTAAEVAHLRATRPGDVPAMRQRALDELAALEATAAH
jgi:mono/diheme cytochrome c family protein